MVGNQIGTLIPSVFFGHNLCFKYSNGTCEANLNIYVLRTFQWYKEIFNPKIFDPLQSFSENSKVHWDFNSQSGSPLGSVWVHSLTPSYTLGSMKCDSRASHLTCTFASPYFGHKPKVRVAIGNFPQSLQTH